MAKLLLLSQIPTVRSAFMRFTLPILTILAVSLLFFSSPTSIEAGLFRKGPCFPVFRNRPGYNKPNQPNPTQPLPPPIVPVDNTLVPVAQPSPTPTPLPTLAEVIKALPEDAPAPTSNLPPWLPIGTAAGGAGAALLVALRRALTSI